MLLRTLLVRPVAGSDSLSTGAVAMGVASDDAAVPKSRIGVGSGSGSSCVGTLRFRPPGVRASDDDDAAAGSSRGHA